LADLAYAIVKDHAASEERQRLARASADREHRSQSKSAWRNAIGMEEGQTPNMKFGTDLVRKLDEWLKQQQEATAGKILESDSVYAKSFSLSDVEWHDERKATVRGHLIVTFEGQKLGAPQSVVNWTRDLEYKSDGVDSWWSAEEPVFAYGGPITEQLKKEPIVILAQKSVQRMVERNR
jgi:hypothetical protein